MPRKKLTAAAVDKLKPPLVGQVDYFDAHLPSFGLRISYSGTKAWFVMARVNGKLFRATLGRYPALTLAEARAKAGNVMDMAASGIDPRTVEVEQRNQRDAELRNTFSKVAEEFMEKHVRRNLRSSTMREYQRILFGSDTKPWQGKPIATITKRDVLNLIDNINGRGSPGTANRALSYLRKFFNWCAEREVIERVPTDRLSLPNPETQRERVLTDEELRYVWQAFEAEKGLFGPLFKLLLLTGQRRGEVAGMRWDELQLNEKEAIWEIPVQRTKNKRPHIVPISTEVAKIITSLPRTGELVFSVTGNTPVSGFGKAKARIDQHIADERTIQDLPHLPGWTLHDLRRTMVTVMNDKLSIPPHIVEAVVNHVSGGAKAGVAGVYNRALYLNERCAALEAWSQWVLKTIVTTTQFGQSDRTYRTAKKAKPSRSKKKLNLQYAGGFLTKEISKVRNPILELIGFFREYELNSNQLETVKNAKEDADEIISEIVGTLFHATLIEAHTGQESVVELISTLKAVQKTPHLLSTKNSKISPVALLEIGKHYQREQESPGTHWYDVTEIGARRISGQIDPIATNVKRAAGLANLDIESDKLLGRPPRSANIHLAKRLTEIFQRFGRKASRIVDPIKTVTDPRERERGDFVEFVRLVIEPLNQLVTRQYGSESKIFSIDTITKLATSRNS